MFFSLPGKPKMSPRSKVVCLAIWTLVNVSFTEAATLLPPLELGVTASDVECYGPNVEYQPETGKCVCVDGTFGDPDFFCSKTLIHFCTIKDPQLLRSFEGQNYFYAYPCPQTVAEISMVLNGSEIKVDVFLGASYDNNSYLMLDGMAIKLLNRTLFFKDEQLTLDGVVISPTSIPDDLSPHLQVVQPDTWLIHALDIMVMVRPYRQIQSGNLPFGIQVSYSQRSVHEVYELCSHVMGEFEDAVSNMGYIYPEVYALKLSIDAYDKFSTKNKQLVSGELQAKCDDVDHAYTSCLITEQTEMLNLCGPLLTNSIMRLCLTFYGYNVMDLFSHCLNAICLDNEVSCNILQAKNIQKCFSSVTGCGT